VLVVALAVALALWLDPLSDVLATLGELDPRWLAAAVALEVASCVSYVIVFRRLFGPVSGRPTGKLAWLGLGAGAVLPGGNVVGLAASCVPLHRDGAPKRALLVRSSVLLLLVNAVCVTVTAVAGVLLLSGAASGPHNLLLAGLPILVCGAIVGVAVAIPVAVRRGGKRAPAWSALLAEAIADTGRLLRRPDRRLLGAMGYPLLDMAALWAACAATGHPPSLAALVLAYNIGYLTSLAPVPAGIGVLDVGLAAALVLYGTPPAAALAAVLVYHAVSAWVPGLGGLGAWGSLRGERRHAQASLRPARARSTAG
jgi:uncharacterized membrane protein YbhN (UPF0104 family)